MKATNSNGSPRRWVLNLTAVLIIAILVAMFTIQNSGMVTIRLATYHWDVSLALLLFASLLVGVILAILTSLPVYWSQRRQLSRAGKELKKAKEKVIESTKFVNGNTTSANAQRSSSEQVSVH